MQDLYKKYKEKYSSKMSLATFKRLRPSWITFLNLSDRETCLCVKHSNMQFIIDALYYKGLISTKKLSEVCELSCCDVNKKDCMYRGCDKCIDNFNITIQKNTEKYTVSYFQWTKVTEQRIMKNNEKKCN